MAGVVGWNRYNYVSLGRGRLALAAQRVFLLVGIVTAIALAMAVGIRAADVAAKDARAAARSNRTPKPYFGLQGRLVCVRSLQQRIPVFNGPIPSDRPLLTFGTSTDQAWLWDAVSGQLLAVRTEDVMLERAVGNHSSCGDRT
ncbi:hypothetical protein AB0O76_37055 [Streptomyces sp. NPDC086554]|uniref:hypothetical protein n=1 Tax=Streptomyces sp. NPDC086554 TaxID=3154864 RepID=UPI0034479023